MNQFSLKVFSTAFLVCGIALVALPSLAVGKFCVDGGYFTEVYNTCREVNTPNEDGGIDISLEGTYEGFAVPRGSSCMDSDFPESCNTLPSAQVPTQAFDGRCIWSADTTVDPWITTVSWEADPWYPVNSSLVWVKQCETVRP